MNTQAAPWLAPTATKPVVGAVQIPGSKSQTNRAYILAALANSESVIEHPLVARDTNLMLDAISSLGAKVSQDGEKVFIEPQITSSDAINIDVGLAGTVMRFVPPLAALSHSKVFFNGDEQARVRPMNVMIDALKQLGVSVNDENNGFLPFSIEGHGHVSGKEITIDASSSSQFVSGLLLAAPRFDFGLTITHQGSNLPSFPHIEMTMQMLNEINIACEHQLVDAQTHRWVVKPSLVAGTHWKIEPDLSNAAPFLAAAMVTSGRVTIKDWPKSTTQAGGYLPEILKKMGAEYDIDENGLTLIGPKVIKPLAIDLKELGELTPAIAALMALADGQSEITGIAHLRGHETDRLAALVHDLTQIGISAQELPDGLSIKPNQLHGGQWRSFADHRMATAGAIIGLRVSGIEIDDIECTSKTMTNFQSLWHNLVSA